MKNYTHIKGLILTCTLTLFASTLCAATSNVAFNSNWKLGAGININNIIKENSKSPSASGNFFTEQTQGMSDPGFTLAAVKPITQRLSFRFDYVQVGNLTETNHVTGKTNQEIVRKNKYIDLLGLYAYPMTHSLDMVGTAGINLNINTQKGNAAAVADGNDPDANNAGFGVAYGAGLQYHIGSTTISLLDMLPIQTDGYLTLDFLYQL